MAGLDDAHMPPDGPQDLARALRRRRTPQRWLQPVDQPPAPAPPPSLPEGDRQPILIKGGAISTGVATVSWYSNHVDDILVAFLEVIRISRGDDEAEVTGFRRIDIDVLSHHLGLPGEDVIEQLAALIGASPTRSAAMLSLYRNGIGMIPTGVDEDEEPAAPVTRLAELLHDGE